MEPQGLWGPGLAHILHNHPEVLVADQACQAVILVVARAFLLLGTLVHPQGLVGSLGLHQAVGSPLQQEEGCNYQREGLGCCKLELHLVLDTLNPRGKNTYNTVHNNCNLSETITFEMRQILYGL